jgi:hypothetical protein
MKKIPRLHFEQFPVTVLKLLGCKTATRKNRKSQQKHDSAPSYIRCNCFLYLPYHGGIA